MGFTIPAVQPRLLMEGHLPAVEATTPTVRKTALNPVHRRMGAKMVEFNGWDMPVEYPSAGRNIPEHHAGRLGVGVFPGDQIGDHPRPRPCGHAGHHAKYTT